jgi:hypothetical protein
LSKKPIAEFRTASNNVGKVSTRNAETRQSRGAKRPRLWVCPQCGHKFVTAKTWHSCSRYPLSHHFKDKDPVVQEVFTDLLKLIEGFGKVTVIPQKTRICFQVRVRFVSAMARKRWLDCGLWLKRRADHPLFYKIEVYGRRDHVHRFRLTRPHDLRDAKLRELLREGYGVGLQDHLYNRRLGGGDS